MENSTHTEKFIEDAIEGGWLPQITMNGKVNAKSASAEIYAQGRFAEVHLLDTLAWKAVGKTRWLAYTRKDGSAVGSPDPERMDEWEESWRYHWHSFIDYLSNGDTIDTALSKIE